MKSFNYIVLLLLLVSVSSYAQRDLVFYRMYKNVAQANNLNPALLPAAKVTVGFPGLAGMSTYFGYQGLSFIDAINPSESNPGSYTFNPSLLLQGNANFRASQSFSYNPLYVGVRTKNGFISVDVQINQNLAFALPNEFMSVLLNGNSGLTDPIGVDDFNMRFNSYYSLGVGYSRILTDKLTVGGRIRYLVGLGDFSFRNFEGDINLTQDEWSINGAGGNMLGAGVIGALLTLEDDEFDEYVSNPSGIALPSNGGFGFDLGGSYQLTDKLNLNASLINLGFIRWNTNLANYQLNSGDVSFTGLTDVFSVFGGETSITDSIFNEFSFDTLAGTSYTTALNGKFYANANYEFFRNNFVGGIVQMDFDGGKVYPALSAYYQFTWKTYFNFLLNASYFNRTIRNVGVGIGGNLAGFEIYFMTDNLLASNFLSTRAVDFRFGLNFVFGNASSLD